MIKISAANQNGKLDDRHVTPVRLCDSPTGNRGKKVHSSLDLPDSKKPEPVKARALHSC
jgi:hypothetical protein